MSEYVSYLLTLLYEGCVLKVAVSIHKDLMSVCMLDFPREYKKDFEKFLPLHAKYPVVDVEEIFEVAINHPEAGDGKWR